MDFFEWLFAYTKIKHTMTNTLIPFEDFSFVKNCACYSCYFYLNVVNNFIEQNKDSLYCTKQEIFEWIKLKHASDCLCYNCFFYKTYAP